MTEGWKTIGHLCSLEGPGGHYIHQSDKECTDERGLSITEKPGVAVNSGPWLLNDMLL